MEGQPSVSQHMARKLVGSFRETRNAGKKANWGEENICTSLMTLKLRSRQGIEASVRNNMPPADLCVALKICGRLAHLETTRH